MVFIDHNILELRRRRPRRLLTQNLYGQRSHPLSSHLWKMRHIPNLRRFSVVQQVTVNSNVSLTALTALEDYIIARKSLGSVFGLPSSTVLFGSNVTCLL